MGYEGLTTDDLANVRALNHAWLDQRWPRDMARLSPQRQERLAATPFLLFSFREHDTGLWRRLLAEREQRDLFRQPPAAGGGQLDLQAAGLAFLWELTRRNPYAARIVSGAPLQWCEQVAATTLWRVLECARSGDLATWRFPGDSPVCRRLFLHGSAAPREPRVAAQVAALHRLLTAGAVAQLGHLRSAACRARQVGRRLSDEV